MCVTGTEDAVAQLFRFRRPLIRVCVGQPFTLPPVERRQRAEMLQRNTDEIMCQIAALLPPEYRGAYADHPRLAELLSANP
jgi:1-acyl-sn-glycerol-3-phosphate acyltransferase